jgi:predicted GNAT family acetyltransferase
VGEVDGEIVTTALGTVFGDCVGVFNVATPEAHRRRGHGAAITARVVTDGLAAGADWAWLQSSEVGYRVYEALGFETVERWSCWVRA